MSKSRLVSKPAFHTQHTSANNWHKYATGTVSLPTATLSKLYNYTNYCKWLLYVDSMGEINGVVVDKGCSITLRIIESTGWLLTHLTGPSSQSSTVVCPSIFMQPCPLSQTEGWRNTTSLSCERSL